MERMDRNTLTKLIRQDPRIAVSLYMPVHADDGRQDHQGPIRLKNLLDEAERQLAVLDINSLELQEMLAPAWKLQADKGFGHGSGEGLALFIAPGVFQHYSVPFNVLEGVQVDTRFHVKPLLPQLGQEGHIYVLALSENSWRLIRAENDTAREVELPGAPANLNASMLLEDREHSMQFHSTGAQHGGDAPRSVHGGGSWNDYEKAQMGQYVRQIGAALNALLAIDRAPLVVAAPERVFAEFKHECHYHGLIEHYIAGNHDDTAPQKLAELAWPLARPQLINGGPLDLPRMRELAGTPQGPVDIEGVVQAAAQGRVETLFLDVEAVAWGSFDEASQTVQVHSERQSDSEDLVELAAVKTLEHAGAIQTLTGAGIPGGGPLASLLRW